MELPGLWSFDAAMSKSIARLETKLDTRLFNRTTRKIHLTGEGQTLYDALSSSFGNIETALERIRTFASQL